MRNLILLSLVSGLCVTHLFADSVQYTLNNISGNEWEYTYTLTGTFNQYQGIQLDLCSATSNPVCNDGSSYSNLVNVSNAGPDWSIQVLQPDNGAAEPGTYLAESLVNNAPVNETFAVEFDYSGSGQPGAQLFNVIQYDSLGNYQSLITSGTTTLMSGSVPEPASFSFSGIGLLVVAAYKAMRRRTSAPAQ